MYTITLGCQAENHVGMQKLGTLGKAGSGFTGAELHSIKQNIEDMGGRAEVFDLTHGVDKAEGMDACVLVIRNAAALFGSSNEELFDEQEKIAYDKQAFMYGRVVNKNMRYNVCFGKEAQEANIAEKRGTVVAWRTVPKFRRVRRKLLAVVGAKGTGLMGEGNHYHNTKIKTCGIGFHGDAERRKVIAFRIGADMPIHYIWFQRCRPISSEITIPLYGGDAYIMSEKAVGTDWRKKSEVTLRHAVGAQFHFTDDEQLKRHFNILPWKDFKKSEEE